MALRPSGAIPLILLTGFLGSGKTTLLRRILAGASGADTAVVVNELGDIGLDHRLLWTASGTTVVLEGGCVCCTVRDDLLGTLAELFWQRLRREIPRFARLVVETTGLADPRHVLAALASDAILAERYRPSAVVATIDAAAATRQLDRHPECRAQAALADLLVLTKGDLVAEAEMAALEARLARLNPLAALHRAARGVIAPEIVFAERRGAVAPGAGALPLDFGHAHGAAIRSFALHFAAPLDESGFDAAFRQVVAGCGEALLRAKGIVRTAGSARPLLIEAVGTMVSPAERLPEGADAADGSWLVFITQGLEAAAVAAAFANAGIAAAGVTP